MENIITPSVRDLDWTFSPTSMFTCLKQGLCLLAGGGGGREARDHQREEGSEAEQELRAEVDEGQEIHQLQVRDGFLLAELDVRLC